MTCTPNVGPFQWNLPSVSWSVLTSQLTFQQEKMMFRWLPQPGLRTTHIYDVPMNDAMWSGYGEIDWIRQSWFNGACCFHYMFGHLGVLLPTNSFCWPLHMICHNLVFFVGHSPNHSCYACFCQMTQGVTSGNASFQAKGWVEECQTALETGNLFTQKHLENHRKIGKSFRMLHEIHQTDGWKMKQKTHNSNCEVLGKGPTSLYS